MSKEGQGIPNYGQDKPTQEGAEAKRQRSLDPRSSHRSLSSRSPRTESYSVSSTGEIRSAGFPGTSEKQWSPSFPSYAFAWCEKSEAHRPAA